MTTEAVDLPTPAYGSLEPSVYEPAEDTFILLDALTARQAQLASLNPSLIAEIGSGSGVVTSYLRSLLSAVCPGSRTLALVTDLNPAALAATRHTAALNDQQPPEAVLSDLLGPFESRLAGAIDILVFNPPYVPTEAPAAVQEELCFAGGPTGRAALDRLLPRVRQLLSPQGRFFLVALKANDVPGLRRTAQGFGLASSVVLERWCGREYLYVVEFVRE